MSRSLKSGTNLNDTSSTLKSRSIGVVKTAAAAFPDVAVQCQVGVSPWGLGFRGLGFIFL